MIRLIATIVLAGSVAGTSHAHHPDRAKKPVRQRIDCIGPLGNNLRPSYRRVYNRPTNLQGKIAYWIAPTSQEAIAWHRAKHVSAYKRGLPRQEPLYFYPKPWESLQIGPRPVRASTDPALRENAFSGPYGDMDESASVLQTDEDASLPALPPQTLDDPLMLPEDDAL